MVQFETPLHQQPGASRLGRRAPVFLPALAVIYAALAAALSSIGAFWSPDGAARFAMIREWVLHGSLIHWSYAYRGIDPTGQIHPLAYFLFHQRNGFCPQYEALFPALSGVMYRAFGYDGLTVIPAASGLGTVFLIFATARGLGLRSASAVAWAAGLGTPILVYSVVFWDHVVMMLLTAGAMLLLWRAVQGEGFRPAAWAGAVLGLGVFIHELMLAVYLAVLLASLPLARRREGRRLVLGLAAGFAPLALLWAGANWVLYGTLGGPHLDANMGGNTADHPFSLASLLDAPAFVDRAREELTGILSGGMMITNTHTDLLSLFAAFGYSLIGYWLLTSFLGPASRLAPALSAGISAFALFLVSQVHWAHGLFLATPLLVPALAVPWDAATQRRGTDVNAAESVTEEAPPASLFYAWMSRAAWLFLFGSILNPMLPGVDWGSRYLLPILPVLVVLAAYALERQCLAFRPAGRRAALACALVTVGVSVYAQAEGLTMIRRNMVYNQAVNRRVLALRTQAVVFSDIGLGAELAAVPVPPPQFLVRTDRDWQLLLRAFHQSGIRDFTYVGDDDGVSAFARLTTLLPGEPKLLRHGADYFHTDPDREDGENLAFVHYALDVGKPPAAR